MLCTFIRYKSSSYRNELVSLKHALKEKRSHFEQRHDKIMLQHNNAQPRAVRGIKAYLETLHWNGLSHPTYSSDIFPSGNYFFHKKDMTKHLY